MNTKARKIFNGTIAALCALSMTACTASEAFPEGITTALTTNKDNSSPSVNYTDTSLSGNPLILSETGDMYFNPVLGPESFGNFGAFGEGYGFDGVADPFVLRYNGMYYLYCTTPGTTSGIKVFESSDLVNWKSVGACPREKSYGDDGKTFTDYFCTDITWGAYAPEVAYDQSTGWFYMYTAEGAYHNDHAVLRFRSPLGPFEWVSWGIEGLAAENSGVASIDGHVFVDDDGQWYFYKAYENDIWCYKMNSPTEIDRNSGKVVVNRMTGDGQTKWTEGPFVIKHNGKYYLTYTGNHCWSEGYRLNYAVSDKPYGDYCFKEMGDNPLLVHQNTFQSAEGTHPIESFENYDGVGHSATVIGPNLDSYYIFYHSLHRGFQQRHTRMDRLSFDGDFMYVLGSTSSAAKPTMPTVYNYFTPSGDSFDLSGFEKVGGTIEVPTVKNGIVLKNNAKLLSTASFDTSWTMECNFMFMPDDGRAGVLFNYNDDNNYGKAIFDSNAQTLTVTFRINGVDTSYTKALVGFHNFGYCQTLMIKRDGNHFTFLVNNRELCDYTAPLGNGRNGSIVENSYVKIGFTAITTDVNESSIKNEFKPVTSAKILAADCKETDYEVISSDGSSAVIVKNDDILNYYISVEIADSGNWDHVSKAGPYDILFRYISYGETKIDVYQNKKKIGTLTLPDTGGQPKTEVIRNAFSLAGGCSVLTFVFDTERFVFSDFELDRYVAVTKVESTTTVAPTGLYSDGDDGWEIKIIEGKPNCWNRCSTTTAYARKKFFGDFNYGDYEAEVHVKYNEGRNAGLIVRGSNPSANWSKEDPSGNNSAALEGTNFYQGYFVYIDGGNNVVLGKASYGWTQLASASCAESADKCENGYYRIKIRAVGATLQVSVNEKVCITYTDPYPFMQGAVGIRALGTNADFVNLSIRPIN